MNGDFQRIATTALPIALGSAGLYAVFYYLHRKQPKQLDYVGTVKELYIHPLKACRGISIKAAECTWFGFKWNGVYDRHYLICDPQNRSQFVGLQHQCNTASITCEVGKTRDHMIIKAPGMHNLSLPKTCIVDSTKTVVCRLYGEESETMDCGDEAADWINKALGTKELRLVYAMGGMSDRISNLFFKETGGIEHDRQFLLPEQSTYNLLSQASLDDLNDRLDESVPVRNFRPNILVDGCGAYDEDDWEEFYINDARFFQFALCERCTITTVNADNPESAHAKKEPLKTLKSYRMKPEWPNGPVFGIRLGISYLGSIQVGDKVYARRKSK